MPKTPEGYRIVTKEDMAEFARLKQWVAKYPAEAAIRIQEAEDKVEDLERQLVVSNQKNERG